MAKELIITKPMSAFSRNAARAALCLGISYSFLLLLLHFIKPELDPTWRFISEYALGRNGWIMTLTFLCLAGSQISMVFAAKAHVKTIIGYIGLFLLCVSALGILIAAFFPTDPITTSPDALSERGNMHALGASLDWTPFAALFISLSLIRTDAWSMKKRALLVAVSVSLILTVLFIVTAASAPDGKFGPGVYLGLVGRLLIWSYLVWIITVTKHIFQLTRQK